MLSATQLQTRLVRLVEEYSGSVEKPPSHVYSGDCHERLSQQNVVDGVCLMSRYLGMSGSAGDVDLYRLNMAYLLDPVARGEIDRIIRR